MASVYAYWYARRSKLLCESPVSLFPHFPSRFSAIPGETAERHNFHGHARKILAVVCHRTRRPVISYFVHLIRHRVCARPTASADVMFEIFIFLIARAGSHQSGMNLIITSSLRAAKYFSIFFILLSLIDSRDISRHGEINNNNRD